MDLKVDLIQSVGTDITVVNAARVSFANESEWEKVTETMEDGFQRETGDIRLSDKDKKLINYLAKHNHFTPFTHSTITMRETVPIFVARQRFKHVIGFSYNEVSRRYVDDEPEFYVPEVWRGKPEKKKQGSSDDIITEFSTGVYKGDSITDRISHFFELATDAYNDLLASGVAPEQARMVLPQSMYTSYYVTGSLAAWARAYKLRIDPHAQKEIQDLAKMWGEVFKTLPELQHSWTALTNTSTS